MTPVRAILIALACFSSSLPSTAETVRVATYNVELKHDGPGLLLRAIQKGDDPRIAHTVAVIAQSEPDIIALQGFDWDHDGVALAAFADLLRASGVTYPHSFAPRPNSGLHTDLDLDGDGRTGGPGDAQGFGAFSGQGGLAVLSRFPVLADQARDFGSILWRDLPGALLPVDEHGGPFPSAAAQAAQRLSSTAHWAVPVDVPGSSPVTLLVFQAGPPVFDGAEDRNGRRNHDEIRLWSAILDGAFGPTVPLPFIILGGANLDPADGDGRHEAIRGLLADTRIRDPQPRSAGAALAGDQGHLGKDALDTVDWEGPGRMRVDYVLPSRDLRVGDAGVYWPAPGSPGNADAVTASRHRLVWVDLVIN